MRILRGGLPGLLLPALMLVAAGCGGKDASSQQAAVRAALVQFDAAQAAGKAGEACKSLVAVDEQGRVEVPGGDAERERGAAAGAQDADADAGAQDADADADAKDADAKDADEKDTDAKDAAEPDGDEASGEADAEARVCERAFTQASASRRILRDVRLDVTSITVRGGKATADTRTRLTRADGTKLDQRATRRLVRLDGRWRIVITEE